MNKGFFILYAGSLVLLLLPFFSTNGHALDQGTSSEMNMIFHVEILESTTVTTLQKTPKRRPQFRRPSTKSTTTTKAAVTTTTTIFQPYLDFFLRPEEDYLLPPPEEDYFLPPPEDKIDLSAKPEEQPTKSTLFDAIIQGDAFAALAALDEESVDIDAAYSFPPLLDSIQTSDPRNDTDFLLRAIDMLYSLSCETFVQAINPQWVAFKKAPSNFTNNSGDIVKSVATFLHLINNTETPLMIAAMKGFASIIAPLVRRNATIGLVNKHGQTALMHAAVANQTETALALIKEGAKLDGCFLPPCTTELPKAAWKGDVQRMKLLLEAKADIDGWIPYIEHGKVAFGDFVINWPWPYDLKSGIKFATPTVNEFTVLFRPPEIWVNQGYTPLILAIANGKMDAAQFLLDKGASVNKGTRADFNKGPLTFAVEAGNFEAVQRLLAQFAEVNRAESRYGWTPLFYAVYKGYARIASELIKNGADVYAVDNKMRSLFSLNATKELRQILESAKSFTGYEWFRAISTNNMTEIIRLVNNHADINQKNSRNATACDIASGMAEGDDIVTFLASLGAECPVSTKWFLAVSLNETDTAVDMAMSNAINVNAKNAAGQTACQIAAKYSETEPMVAILMALGAACPIEVQWFAAVASGYLEDVDTMVRQNVSLINLKNLAGETACELASKNENGAKIAEFLRSMGATSCLSSKRWFIAIASRDMTEIKKLVIEFPGVLSQTNENGETACQVASKRTDSEDIVRFLKSIGDHSCVNLDEWFNALAMGMIANVRHMALEFPEIVNQVNVRNETSCQVAARSIFRYQNVIDLLEDLGASCVQGTKWFSAVNSGNLDAVKRIVLANPRITLERNHAGYTACEMTLNVAILEFLASLDGPSGCAEEAKWFLAVSSRDTARVQKLLELGIGDVNMKNSAGETACDVASKSTTGEAVIEVLLAKGAFCSQKIRWFHAVANGNVAQVLILALQNPNLANEKNSGGQTACDLAFSLTNGDGTINVLNSIGLPCQVPTVSWFTAIAAVDFEQVKVYVEKMHADINVVNSLGETACEITSKNPKADHITKYLAELGANCPLEKLWFLAISTNTWDDVQKLIECLNDVNIINSDNMTACQIAAEMENTTLYEFLQDYGAQCPDSDNKTQWFGKVNSGDIGKLDKFRDEHEKFNIDIKNAAGWTGCQIAQSTRNESVIRWFSANGSPCCKKVDMSLPMLSNADLVGRGYDIFFGNPEPTVVEDLPSIDPGYREAIHDLSCGLRESNDRKFLFPQNMEAAQTQMCQSISFESQRTTSSTEFHNAAISSSLEVSSGGYGEVSATAGSGYQKTSEMLRSANVTIIRSKATCTRTSLTIQPHKRPPYIENFLSALKKLPLNKGDCRSHNHRDFYKSNPAFEAFIRKYGTHVIDSAKFGAKFVIQREITDKSLSELLSQGVAVENAAAAVSYAHFKAAINNYDNEAKKLESVVERTCYVTIGARPGVDPNGQLAWAHQDFQRALPVWIKLTILPDLLSETMLPGDTSIEAKKTCLNSVIRGYCETLVAEGKMKSCDELPADPPKCGTLPPLFNGQYSDETGFHVGDTRKIICHHGYILKQDDPSEIRCQQNGQWSWPGMCVGRPVGADCCKWGDTDCCCQSLTGRDFHEHSFSIHQKLNDKDECYWRGKDNCDYGWRC